MPVAVSVSVLAVVAIVAAMASASARSLGQMSPEWMTRHRADGRSIVWGGWKSKF